MAQIEPQPEPQGGAQPEPQGGPQPEPQGGPQPEPQVGPQPEPQGEPQPEPQVEPQPEPQVVPTFRLPPKQQEEFLEECNKKLVLDPVSGVLLEPEIFWECERKRLIHKWMNILKSSKFSDETRMSTAEILLKRIEDQFHLFYLEMHESVREYIREELLELLEKRLSRKLRTYLTAVVANVAAKIMRECGHHEYIELLLFLTCSMNENLRVKKAGLLLFTRVWPVLMEKQRLYIRHIIYIIHHALEDSDLFVHSYGVTVLFYVISENDSSEPEVLDQYNYLLPYALEMMLVIKGRDKEIFLSVLMYLKIVAMWRPDYLEQERTTIWNLCFDIIAEIDDSPSGEGIKLAIHILSLLPLNAGEAPHINERIIKGILKNMCYDTPQWIYSTDVFEDDTKRENVVEDYPLYHVFNTSKDEDIFEIVIKEVISMFYDPTWENQVTSLNAISAMSEFCWYHLDMKMNRFTGVIAKSLQHDVPYVRYAACLAVSNLSKHCQLIFTQDFHDKIIGNLLPKPQDTWRVRSMALNALRNYIKHSHRKRKTILFNKDTICKMLVKTLQSNNSSTLTLGFQHHLLHELISTILVTYDCLGLDDNYKVVLNNLYEMAKRFKGHNNLALVYKCVYCMSSIAFNLNENSKIESCYRADVVMKMFDTRNEWTEIPKDPDQLLWLLHSWKMLHEILGNNFMKYYDFILVNKLIIQTLSATPKKKFLLTTEHAKTTRHNPNWYHDIENKQLYGIRREDCEHIMLAHKLLDTFLKCSDVAAPYIGEIRVPLSKSLTSFNNEIKILAIKAIVNLVDLGVRKKRRAQLKLQWSYIRYALTKAAEDREDEEEKKDAYIVEKMIECTEKCQEKMKTMFLPRNLSNLI